MEVKGQPLAFYLLRDSVSLLFTARRQDPPNFPILTSHATIEVPRLQTGAMVPNFHTGHSDSNPGPFASKTSALPTEQSSQLPFYGVSEPYKS